MSADAIPTPADAAGEARLPDDLAGRPLAEQAELLERFHASLQAGLTAGES